ncbi:hypothetical protein [Salipiger aestuarii]|uniref:hypothetical protein n=1 Tax=Salipiger aestuarii TaxID=568098 RepID=UPI0012385A9B|nr:hypothetical protein [Salipiger aestuarii]
MIEPLAEQPCQGELDRSPTHPPTRPGRSRVRMMAWAPVAVHVCGRCGGRGFEKAAAAPCGMSKVSISRSSAADTSLSLACDAPLFAPYAGLDTPAINAGQDRATTTPAAITGAIGQVFNGLRDLDTATPNGLAGAGKTTIEERPAGQTLVDNRANAAPNASAAAMSTGRTLAMSDVLALATAGFPVVFRSCVGFDEDVPALMFGDTGAPTPDLLQPFDNGVPPCARGTGRWQRTGDLRQRYRR